MKFSKRLMNISVVMLFTVQSMAASAPQNNPANIILAAARKHKAKKYAEALSLLKFAEAQLNQNLVYMGGADVPMQYPPYNTGKIGNIPVHVADATGKTTTVTTKGPVQVAPMNASEYNQQWNSFYSAQAYNPSVPNAQSFYTQGLLGPVDLTQYTVMGMTKEIIPKAIDLKENVQAYLNNLKARVKKDAATAKVSVAKLPDVQDVLINTALTQTSPFDPTRTVPLAESPNADLTGLPTEYRSILFELNNSLTFRDVRLVRRQRSIDAKNFGGIMNPLYSGGNNFGNLGFDIGPLGSLVLSANILGKDFDKIAIEYMRRYDGLSVDTISDSLITNAALIATPAGVLADLFGKFGPQAPRLNAAQNGNTIPTNPNTPYDPTLPFPGSLSNGPFGGMSMPTIQNSLNRGQSLLQQGGNLSISDSIVIFFIYSNLILKLAALYDVRLETPDLYVLMGLVYSVARFMVFARARYPKGSQFFEVSAARSVGRFIGEYFKNRNVKGKRTKELAIALDEVNKILKPGQMVEETIKTRRGGQTIQDVSKRFEDQVLPKSQQPPILADPTSPLNLPNMDSDGSLGLPPGWQQMDPTKAPGGGWQAPPPTAGNGGNPGGQMPFPPDTSWPPGTPGGQIPKQGQSEQQRIRKMTFKQVIGVMGYAALSGGLRYAEAKVFGNAAKIVFQAAYDKRRQMDNQKFRMTLLGFFGMPFIRMLHSAMDADNQVPLQSDFDNYQIKATDSLPVRQRKNQIRFIRNIARSAQKCRVLTQAQLNRMKADAQKLADTELKLVGDARKLLVCQNQTTNLNNTSYQAKPSALQKVQNFVSALVKGETRARTQEPPMTTSKQCTPTNEGKFKQLAEAAQAARAKAADIIIESAMCRDSSSSRAYEQIKAHFRTGNAIPFDASLISSLQELEFENRLRMGELIIQLQMLDGDFSADDYQHFTQMVLPTLGLSNQVAIQYFSNYQAFINKNGQLVHYPYSPTGFKIQNVDRADVYDWGQGYSPPHAPSTKLIDYVMNPREPYSDPLSGSYGTGGYGGLGGGMLSPMY